MGFFNQFPYTNFHELNLDWLLEKVKDYENVFKRIEKEWEELWDAIQQFPNDLYTFETEVRNKLASLSSQILEIKYQIMTFNFATKTEVAEGDLRLAQQIETNVLTLKSDVKMLYTYIDRNLADLQEYVDREDYALLKLIQDIQVEPVQMVINPFTGEQDTVQDTFEMVYKAFQFFGVTAIEYRRLHLTAEEYRNKHLTAWEYDTLAKWYLGPWPWVESSPMCLTAGEYAKLGLTAEEYRDAGLTAWQYDKRSLWYLGKYPFAADSAGVIHSKLY